MGKLTILGNLEQAQQQPAVYVLLGANLVRRPSVPSGKPNDKPSDDDPAEPTAEE